MNSLYLALMHGFNIHGLIFKPSDIICHKMNIITSSTPDKHNSFMIGMLGKWTDWPCLAFSACETQDIELTILSLYSLHPVHYRYRVLCLYNLNLLFSYLRCFTLYFLHLLWNTWHCHRLIRTKRNIRAVI